jgi:hypothetical protein
MTVPNGTNGTAPSKVRPTLTITIVRKSQTPAKC